MLKFWYESQFRIRLYEPLPETLELTPITMPASWLWWVTTWLNGVVIPHDEDPGVASLRDGDPSNVPVIAAYLDTAVRVGDGHRRKVEYGSGPETVNVHVRSSGTVNVEPVFCVAEYL
jgi:hypothetical protein